MELEEKRESSERLRLNKKIMWGITIISILLAMFYIDKQKVYKEEKPPMPTVLLGEQELHPILSTYTWNAGKIEKEIKDLTQLIEYQHAEFRENLNIEFPKISSQSSLQEEPTIMEKLKQSPIKLCILDLHF